MKGFVLLTAAGFVALAITVIFGFEEANGMMLLIASLLLFAAPAAVLVQLTFTHDLTSEEKRLWLRALTGRRALQAWSVYLGCSDRRRALSQLGPKAATGEA
jgi:hypothetical protein